MTAPAITTTLPMMCEVRRRLPSGDPVDIPVVLRVEWERLNLAEQVHGKSIALGFGSRGVASIDVVARELVAIVRESGGEPFIVPAMGSHGGATPAGQLEVLDSLGISEAKSGCPVRATMETVRVGETAKGVSAHVGRYAYDADGIIVVNRVKPHTDFRASTESGLVKMLGLGLGKEDGASTIHRRGVRGLREDLPQVTRVLLNKLNIICGIATVEDSYHRPVMLQALPPATFITGEEALLEQARTFMPRLPVDSVDVLVVDYIGKEISGTGMDTNVIGRLRIEGEPESPDPPTVQTIVTLDLTEASHGNALGVGLSDFTTQRLLDKIDFPLMAKNVFTSGFLMRGNVPLVYATPAAAVEAAIAHVYRENPAERTNARVVHIRDTMHLETVRVSANLLDAVRQRDDFISSTDPTPMHFEPFEG